MQSAREDTTSGARRRGRRRSLRGALVPRTPVCPAQDHAPLPTEARAPASTGPRKSPRHARPAPICCTVALLCLGGLGAGGCGTSALCDESAHGARVGEAPPPTPGRTPSLEAPGDAGSDTQPGLLRGRADQIDAPLGVLRSGILDGERSGADDFVATGAILYSSAPSRRPKAPPIGAMICSGTLIAPDVVLAAGHCQEHGINPNGAGLDYYFSLSPDVSHFGPHVDALPEGAVRVAHFEAHPDYDGRDVREGEEVADIALLFLQEPIHSVAPATLLPARLSAELYEGREVAIVGYGRRSLHFFGTQDGGVKTHGRSTLHEVGMHELKVGVGPSDAHKCWGDSGGPTFLRDAQGALQLVGITSRAVDLGGCRSGGIDTRVDAYGAWIAAAMEAACGTAQRPACGAQPSRP